MTAIELDAGELETGAELADGIASALARRDAGAEATDLFVVGVRDGARLDFIGFRQANARALQRWSDHAVGAGEHADVARRVCGVKKPGTIFVHLDEVFRV